MMKITKKGKTITVKGHFAEVEELKKELENFGILLQHSEVLPELRSSYHFNDTDFNTGCDGFRDFLVDKLRGINNEDVAKKLIEEVKSKIIAHMSNVLAAQVSWDLEVE